jgi:hypothetical protein
LELQKRYSKKINYNFKNFTELTAPEFRCLSTFFQLLLELSSRAMPNTTLLGSTPPPHEADLFLMTLGEAAEINLFLVEKTLQISAYFLPLVAAAEN